MRQKVLLALALVAIVGAIVFLESPQWFAPPTGEQPDVALGTVPNPEGDVVGLDVGAAAPDFALRDLDGKVVRLSQFRASRFVIVNFWASWCGPCKVEMPDLENVYQRHRDQLVVLGIDLQESADDVRAFLKDEVSVSYPILFDASGEVAETYNKFTQPTTFLLDKGGLIRTRKFGAFTSEELDQRVEELLGGNGGAALQVPVESVALQGAVTQGPLGEKYFGPGEAHMLGAHVDLSAVPHRTDVDWQVVRLGCPVVDCLPSIDAPRFEPASEAKWLADDDVVLAVTAYGEAKAYPINILNWHEVVNDRFGEVAVVASFCPLCNAALVFVAPRLDGQTATFGVSGRVYRSDLVLYDRVTHSLWSQLDGVVIAGPLTGRAPQLRRLPADLVRWGDWRSAHPEGRVLARPTTADPLGGQPPRHTPAEGRLKFDYDQDIYRHYKANPYDLRFPVALGDRRLGNKDEVLGVWVSGGVKAYPKALLERVQIVNDVIAGTPVVLVRDKQTGGLAAFERTSERPVVFQDDALSDGQNRWSLDGQALNGGRSLTQLETLTTYWFAWAAFHAEAALFEDPA